MARPSRPLWEKHPCARDRRVVYHDGEYVIDNEYCCDVEDSGDDEDDDGDDDDDDDECALRYVTVQDFVDQFFDFEFDEKAWSEELSNRNAGKYAGMSADAIRRKWKRDGTDARTRRKLKNDMHLALRSFFDVRDIPAHTVPIEFFLFQDFQRYVRKQFWHPYRNAWHIFDDERGMVGTVDMLYRDADHQMIMVEWKRRRFIRTDEKKRARQPLGRHADCDFIRYGFRMHMYKYILEKYYGLVVKRMIIVAMHPEHRDVMNNVHDVPPKSWATDCKKLVRRRERTGGGVKIDTVD